MTNFIRQFFLVVGKEGKKKFILLMVLMIFNSALSLLGIAVVFPFVFSLLFPSNSWMNILFPHVEHKHLLVYSSCLIAVVFLLKNISSYFCLKLQTKVLYRMAYQLSKRLFMMYLYAPYESYLSRSTQDIIRNLLNECGILVNGIFSPLGNLLAEFLTCMVIFSALVYINPLFTLLVAFGRLTRRRVNLWSQGRAKAWSLMVQNIIQMVSGVKEIKIYKLQKNFANAFNKNAEAGVNAAIFSTLYIQSSRFVLEAGTAFVVMLAIIFMLLSGEENSKIIMLLSVFSVAVMQILPSVNRLMSALTTLKYSMSSFNILVQELTLEKRCSQQQNILSPITMDFKKTIELARVSFSYANEKQVLENISLKIYKGQSVALVGHSGAGKTTLVDILLGVLSPSAGQIWVDDVLMDQSTISAWQTHLAYIPQSIYLYDCSIKENIAFGFSLEDIDEAAVWEALELASLKSFVEGLPDQLNALIGENGIRLSGGQRQRIGIARALFREPAVLVMDEATAALDNQTEKEVTQAIARASQNRTIITIAHRLSTIRHSDVIFVLDQGKLIASGSYDELLTQCELFQQLVKIAVA